MGDGWDAADDQLGAAGGDVRDIDTAELPTEAVRAARRAARRVAVLVGLVPVFDLSAGEVAAVFRHRVEGAGC